MDRIFLRVCVTAARNFIMIFSKPLDAPSRSTKPGDLQCRAGWDLGIQSLRGEMRPSRETPAPQRHLRLELRQALILWGSPALCLSQQPDLEGEDSRFSGIAPDLSPVRAEHWATFKGPSLHGRVDFSKLGHSSSKSSPSP